MVMETRFKVVFTEVAPVYYSRSIVSATLSCWGLAMIWRDDSKTTKGTCLPMFHIGDRSRKTPIHPNHEVNGHNLNFLRGLEK